MSARQRARLAAARNSKPNSASSMLENIDESESEPEVEQIAQKRFSLLQDESEDESSSDSESDAVRNEEETVGARFMAQDPVNSASYDSCTPVINLFCIYIGVEYI